MCPIYVINQLATLNQESLGIALLTYLYALLIDAFLLRLIPIFFGSLYEAKANLKNCYYLTEAHGNSSDTTRDLIEEEMNLIGEFYETYDRPIVSSADHPTSFGERHTTV